MNRLLTLVAADAKRVRRDSFLLLMLVYPWVTAFVLRWALPLVGKRLEGRFDLVTAYPLLACLTAVLLPFTLGLVLGFQLLEEKEIGFLAAIAVTPLSVSRYLAARSGVYGLVGLPLLIVAHEAFGLVDVDLALLALVSIAAAPAQPLMALLVSSFASNQVEGFAVMKASGFLMLAPLLSVFLPGSWDLAVGVLPTYWPIKAYLVAVHGQVAATLGCTIVALVYQVGCVALLYRRFAQRVLGS